ncbi:PIG-L deacetylase family protein [Nocardia alni]|uniref:PIG-L deacetylase family protein n=1 Tax=Nocardia alni TaxID=2815723 RepID=UPI001C2182B2|nr:PIG-L family deacetylase [Nocardia alni]
MAASPVIDPAATGTPHEVWSRWRRGLPVLPTAGCRHVIVLAAHPDDEVLGAGGLIALARSHGVPVTIVVATNGEASHPNSPSHSPEQLARIRIEESRLAAGELAAEPPVRLGLADGDLTAQQTLLGERLHDILSRHGGADARCVSVWRHDGHPDHEAVGRAGAAACGRTGTPLIEFPVWMWHWATPEHPLLRGIEARRLPLPGTARNAKIRALNRFRSQTLPLSDDPADRAILPPHVLERFTGSAEVFFL